ncbi:hypothetical protein ACQ7DA_14830 [Zafaria sp. J156]|uniref:hypothetical protein n=1 Tax=Zafaria sp. J156 TaxID=3116490 RepID=UPI002E78DEB6|nr:hypothetical protein [Zafaria sp. J156]MEE1620239.1 hypothetical protein [Zafaria sp. J156]
MAIDTHPWRGLPLAFIFSGVALGFLNCLAIRIMERVTGRPDGWFWWPKSVKAVTAACEVVAVLLVSALFIFAYGALAWFQ